MMVKNMEKLPIINRRLHLFLTNDVSEILNEANKTDIKLLLTCGKLCHLINSSVLAFVNFFSWANVAFIRSYQDAMTPKWMVPYHSRIAFSMNIKNDFPRSWLEKAVNEWAKNDQSRYNLIKWLVLCVKSIIGWGTRHYHQNAWICLLELFLITKKKLPEMVLTRKQMNWKMPLQSLGI
jgi:hypothetical protein